jgi:hypothetical protein
MFPVLDALIYLFGFMLLPVRFLLVVVEKVSSFDMSPYIRNKITNYYKKQQSILGVVDMLKDCVLSD